MTSSAAIQAASKMVDAERPHSDSRDRIATALLLSGKTPEVAIKIADAATKNGNAVHCGDDFLTAAALIAGLDKPSTVAATICLCPDPGGRDPK